MFYISKVKLVSITLLFLFIFKNGYSQDARFYHSKGIAHWNGERYDLSEENYRKAVWLEPNNLHYRTSLAQILAKRNRYKEAQHEFLQCIGKDSTYVPAYRLSGWHFYKVGQYRKALRRFEKGLKFECSSGNSREMYRRIGETYAALLKTEGLDSVETNRMFEAYKIFVSKEIDEEFSKEAIAFLQKMKPLRPKSFKAKWFYKE